ncbi:DUF4349 domain-containing protein [Eisenibacter elegans]|uniref:DUF4349 domain-containing protein n=1 Tax=Eisenibacter elegans TaxID=997 RepID=UPI0004205637|nr:DUF4349 domain-containing protein [Eisenibacter elegans]
MRITNFSTQQRLSLVFLGLTLLGVLPSCGGGGGSSEGYRQKSAATEAEYAEESAASYDTQEAPRELDAQASEIDQRQFVSLDNRLNLDSSGREFIRTARLRFEVKQVKQATLKVENLVAQYKGFIISAQLESKPRGEYYTPISADSTCHTRVYHLQNQLTLRIPSRQLDAFLKELQPLVQYLEYFRQNAEDVSLLQMQKRVAARRWALAASQQQQNVAQKPGDLMQTSDVQTRLLYQQLQADEQEFEVKQLADQVAFATVYLELYESSRHHQVIVADTYTIKPYRPSFGKRALDALQGGWEGLVNFVLLLFRWWPGVLMLTAIAGWWIYRKRKA